MLFGQLHIVHWLFGQLHILHWTNNNTCIKHNSDDWKNWKEWSPCTKTCGIGTKTRERECQSANCLGHPIDVKVCRNKPCKGNYL